MGDRWIIYCHIHVDSGRRYVGLTKTTMLKRWNRHIYSAHRSAGRSHFANAIKKYGKDAFSHEVLETCYSLEAANAAEIRLIEEPGTRDPLKGFNLARGGNSYQSRSLQANPWERPEYRARMLEVKKGLWANPAYRASLTGWKHSASARQKISASSSSLRHLPDTKEKISSSLRKTKSSIVPKKLFCKECGKSEEETTFRISRPGSRFPRRTCKKCASKARREAKTACPKGHPFVDGSYFLSKTKCRVCLLCARTHCSRGHELTPENTRVSLVRGRRDCRECLRARNRAVYVRRRSNRQVLSIVD